MLHYLHVAATMTGLVLQMFAYAEMKSLKGTIMSVTESQVQVQQGTESVTVFISKDTKVSLNGKDVKVSDLKMNDVAEVSAEENGDRTFKALTIKATRSDKQPAVPR
jgi:hypothetical protein